MSKDELKRRIARKFGSYHNFARLIGVQALRGKTPKEIDVLASQMSRNGAGGGIPVAKLSLLKTRILALYGSVEEFCKKEGFSPISVWQILQGRRKRMSPVVTRLFKHFEI
jgi:hypothetical protein